MTTSRGRTPSALPPSGVLRLKEELSIVQGLINNDQLEIAAAHLMAGRWTWGIDLRSVSDAWAEDAIYQMNEAARLLRSSPPEPDHATTLIAKLVESMDHRPTLLNEVTPDMLL